MAEVSGNCNCGKCTVLQCSCSAVAVRIGKACHGLNAVSEHGHDDDSGFLKLQLRILSIVAALVESAKASKSCYDDFTSGAA